MGGVFLILGASFVFAPQIVSGVNKFMAAVFRRPLKTKVAEHSSPPVPPLPELNEVQGTPTEATDEPDHSPFEPPSAQPSDAISRLREEISASWGRPDGR
jgi:hypothetical protein